MRIILFLSVLLVVALVIDASAFGGRYKRAVLLETNYHIHQFAYRVSGYFQPSLD